jgi:hypothetical protein
VLGAVGSWLARCARVDRSHSVILYNHLIFYFLNSLLPANTALCARGNSF